MNDDLVHKLREVGATGAPRDADPDGTENTFVPISCHACTIANRMMSLCLHCRKYFCADHWSGHTCRIDAGETGKTPEPPFKGRAA